MKITTIVLTESGYRCAVPTCRGILALDMHHIWEVSGGGGDDPSNLIALCPTCHSLYHRGTIKADSIYAYKAMLVALSSAFDFDAVDRLLFLKKLSQDYLLVTGDGLLQFARLIAAGLVEFSPQRNAFYHRVRLSEKDRLLVSAWEQGDRVRLASALGNPQTMEPSASGSEA